MRYQRQRRRSGEPAPLSESTGSGYCDHNPIPAQLRRRRDASYRLVPLDCGCPTGPHAEPLACRCTFPPLTEHQLDGWADAARHVLAGGQTPMLPIEARRGLWRRGGADRELAELLHDAFGGVVA